MEGLIRYRTFVHKNLQSKNWLFLLALVYVSVFIFGLSTYIQWQSVNLILGTVSLFFCSQIQRQQTGSIRFGIVSIIMLLLLMVMPIKTLLFLAIVSAVIFLIEAFIGKINALPLFSLLLMSPFFQYMSNVFVFPIRLELSKWAGEILNASGSRVEVNGNVLIANGQEFSVDAACLGLNMLVTSLLIAVMLIGIIQKKQALQINIYVVLGILAFTFFTNIICNLLRILMLVQFSIMPAEIMHDITGLACLLLYVCIPTFLIIKWAIKKFGKPPVVIYKQGKTSIKLHLLIALSLCFLAFKTNNTSTGTKAFDAKAFSEKGYKVKVLDDEVVKLDNGKSLIYIKPIPHFYNADHNPMICWKGSGYELKRINTTTVRGLQLYTARLEKGNEVLYTSWWYDNGQKQTISQMNWRWSMLKGASSYSIINVTGASPKMLETEIVKFAALYRTQ